MIFGRNGAGRSADRPAAAVPAGITWAVLLFAAPFADMSGWAAVVWGTGAALLIAVFPWVLVSVLDRRRDLRSGLHRRGAPPVILGAAGAGFVLLRVILWLGGPLSLAAVIFAMIAAYAVLLLVERVRPLSWRAISSGAAVVILPALLYAGCGYAVAAAGAVAGVIALVAAVEAERHRGTALAAAGLGAGAGGGVGFWLLNVPL